MNTLEQLTFIDRLNTADAALSDLANYADNLAARLVGYADEASEGYPDTMPSNGLLPSVGDTASRMLRKVEEIRRCLNRVNQTLPPDLVKGTASSQGIAAPMAKW